MEGTHATGRRGLRPCMSGWPCCRSSGDPNGAKTPTPNDKMPACHLMSDDYRGSGAGFKGIGPPTLKASEMKRLKIV